MNIFILDSDGSDFDFYTVMSEGVLSCVELESETKDKVFEKHTITFKRMTYGMQIKIQNASMQESDGRLVFNPISFRSERFMHSLKKWSFKDPSGVPVPVSKQNMENMSDKIANFLLELFEKKMFN